MAQSLRSAAFDDLLEASIEAFYQSYQANPPNKAISRSQLHALVSHTTGAGQKGLRELVNHQKQRDRKNKEAYEKQHPGKTKEGNYESFWLLWGRYLEQPQDNGQITLKGLCEQVAPPLQDALCLLFVGRVAAKLTFAAQFVSQDNPSKNHQATSAPNAQPKGNQGANTPNAQPKGKGEQRKDEPKKQEASKGKPPSKR
ncbi:hypothetical protein L6R29_19340 [Myxococcota bacterium]|nr:hypothetical protein [Myxococcota bacterium]